MTHSPEARVLLLCCYHIMTLCDQLPNRRTATWNLYVNYVNYIKCKI